MIIMAVTIYVIVAIIDAVTMGKHALLRILACFFFSLLFFGIAMYISKTGGITQRQKTALYISHDIFRWFQSQPLAMFDVGYIIAVGRVMFPALFLHQCITESMAKPLHSKGRISWIVYIIPASALILYFPPVFLYLIEKHITLHVFLAVFMQVYICVYLLCGAFLCFNEVAHTKTPYCKHRIGFGAGFRVALTIPFLFICFQDPIQAYSLFSSKLEWFYYLRYVSVSATYNYIVVSLVFICIITAASSSYIIAFRFRQISDHRANRLLQRIFSSSSLGLGIMVHRMKNQLISIELLSNEIGAIESKSKTPIKKVLKDSNLITEIATDVVDRLDKLYRKFKDVRIGERTLCHASALLAQAADQVRALHAEADIIVSGCADDWIEAYDEAMVEAIVNIIKNAVESTENTGRLGTVTCCIRDERKFVVIVISDNGVGMSQTQRKQMCLPFFTTKASEHYWGIGLYFAQRVIIQHKGVLRADSQENKGTDFMIILPKYDIVKKSKCLEGKLL